MNKFLNSINTMHTENGAITKASTGSALYNFFGNGAALRGQDEGRISRTFQKAFEEDSLLALKTLFYIRDIREGQGERQIFKTILAYLLQHKVVNTRELCKLIPEYGRWDDLLIILESDNNDLMVLKEVIINQLTSDVETKTPSLLAKWLPSVNTSSKDTVKKARNLCKLLNMSEKDYRTTLADLRKKINILETHLSNKDYTKIDYSRIPSNASLKYRKAFYRNDEDRYQTYLSQLEKGETKINTGTLYPYDIVSKVYKGEYDKTLELAWKNLPEIEGSENSIVVCDTSASMRGKPIEVALSLTIYMAERLSSSFKDHFITFSAKPQLQKIVGNTLLEKLNNLIQADWDMNTNFQAMFDLILNRAIQEGLKQEDLPEKIYIISDMEFDEAQRGGFGRPSYQTNFEVIQDKYRNAGYDMPKLVFWNVNSRNDQTPVTMKDDYTYLVSGCSPKILKYAVGCKALNGYDLMKDVLNSDRYKPVENLLK